MTLNNTQNLAVLIKESSSSSTSTQKQLVGIISPTMTAFDQYPIANTDDPTNYSILSNSNSSFIEALRLLEPMQSISNAQFCSNIKDSSSSIAYSQQLGCFKYPSTQTNNNNSTTKGNDYYYNNNKSIDNNIIKATVTIYFIDTTERYFICKNQDVFKLELLFEYDDYDNDDDDFKNFNYFVLD